MRLNDFKYLFSFSIPILVYCSLVSSGWMTFLGVLYIFVVLPIIELFIPISDENTDPVIEKKRSSALFFDLLLYINLPIQILLLYLFCTSFEHQSYTIFETTGRILSMGMACGILGINVAHELGHRTTWYEKGIAQLLLLSSLYLHFFIEHNRGHHKYVATLKDPATARFNESVYRFWVRSVVMSYVSAWHIQSQLLNKNGHSFFSFNNTLLLFQFIQLLLLVGIFFWFGFFVLCCFIGAALVGILLLETVNYIEHYGLLRKATSANNYERVMPCHSWNSNHKIGRIVLFELTRHSDHHYLASRRYQVLRHFNDSPQLPLGYPASMLVSLVPPLWFRIIHPILLRINKLNDKT